MNAVNNLKKYFPFKATEADVKSLVIAIVLYLVVGAIAVVVMAVVALVPIVNLLLGVVGTLVDLYCLAGIVLAILDFLGILK